MIKTFKCSLLVYFIGVALVSISLSSCKKQKVGMPKVVKEKVILSDDQLLDKVQKQTIDYFWTGAEPVSGLARERIHTDGVYPVHDKAIITTGGSGFGLMAIVVGVERNFIERAEALARMEKITSFLERADRFHGAWPHWLLSTGKVTPFSEKDNGGDLVETAFLVQGLLTVQAYFDRDNEREKALRNKIQKLWEGVEWSWYTKGGEDVLYWHWSPEYEWDMDFAVKGYNEALIMYTLAAASPTFPIASSVYEKGWARSGEISKGTTYYGLDTELDHYPGISAPVGPLFWAHYSFLGMNPNGLKDQYGDYYKMVTNHALINYKHCVLNPSAYAGYGPNCWGLTSSYSIKGYAGHRPDKDLSVISPTAALSSIPYTPKESLQMIRWLYEEKPKYIGKYGPFDAFSIEKNWFTPRYLAIDQGPIPVMIENYRSGLVWNLFMSNADVQKGLDRLKFNYLKNAKK